MTSYVYIHIYQSLHYTCIEFSKLFTATMPEFIYSRAIVANFSENICALLLNAAQVNVIQRIQSCRIHRREITKMTVYFNY